MELPRNAEGAASLEKIAGGERVAVYASTRSALEGALVRAQVDSLWVLPDAAEGAEAVALADVLRVEQRTPIGGAVDGAPLGGVVAFPVAAVTALAGAVTSIGNERAGQRVALVGFGVYAALVTGAATVRARKGRRWEFRFVSPQEDRVGAERP